MIDGVIVVQAIGILAMAFDLFSAAQKNDKRMVLLSATGCSTFALHYYLLGAYSGMFSEIFNASRNLISLKWKYRSIGFAFAGINAAMITQTNTLLETLPYISGIIISLSLYNLEGTKLRLGYICGFSLWLIYTFHEGSIGGVLMFSTAIILYATNIYRLRKEAA